MIGGVAAGVVLAALLLVLALSLTPAFSITGIDVASTDHLSSDTIARLADVNDGTTLLNVDVDTIESNVKRNPWVESVSVEREFPGTLKLEVKEHSVEAVVLMASGDVAWYLSDSGTWIEPFNVTSSGGSTSGSDSALARAQELGCLLIKDVPASVSPSAGSSATDGVIKAVLEYQSSFSQSFSSQIVSYSAASEAAISCVLDSGVEVSLGAATNISTKESVASKILSEYPNQVTYINVRVPSQPSYRKVDLDSVEEGTDVADTTDAETTEATTSSDTTATTTATTASD